jgi:hypothetical protein
MDLERELADCRYYAVFDRAVDVERLERATVLVRQPEDGREEIYAGHNMWRDTGRFDQIRGAGRDWTDDYRPLNEAEALQVRQRLDAESAARYRHHVVSADGGPFAVVLTTDEPNRWPQQLLGRERARTDLLDRVPDEPTWTVEEVTAHAATEVLAHLEVRRREEAGLTGGRAVFHRLADVLDLDSAHAVVREPGHEFSVRLTESEAELLTALLHIRNAKRQAAPIGEHQYFALFEGFWRSADLRNAWLVVRSTTTTWPQRWEKFQRPGGWLPASRPGRHTLLPLGKADLERLIS